MAENDGPNDTQKATLKGLIKEGAKEAFSELMKEHEDKKRTGGDPPSEKPKSFFEVIGFG